MHHQSPPGNNDKHSSMCPSTFPRSRGQFKLFKTVFCPPENTKNETSFHFFASTFVELLLSSNSQLLLRAVFNLSLCHVSQSSSGAAGASADFHALAPPLPPRQSQLISEWCCRCLGGLVCAAEHGRQRGGGRDGGAQGGGPASCQEHRWENTGPLHAVHAPNGG